MPFSASMKFRRKVCANLWMTVEKKKERTDRTQRRWREKSAATAGEASGGSVKRIIEEVDADAAHAIGTEGLDVRYATNEFAFEGREGFNFLGNFQAKLKLDSFAEFEVGRKIGAALGDVHGLRRN